MGVTDFASNLCNIIASLKTRVFGENGTIVGLLWLTLCHNVTDRQTDRDKHDHTITALSVDDAC